MKKSRNVQISNDEVNIIESIKIIEEQINSFEETKPLFFQKKRLQRYNDRIKNLECVRRYLYKRLEHQIDKNKNYLE